ncbi:MAG: DRTGG domain-containing protein [bacterium]|nr:DRTGG domain-containing protein [bacterium]
MTLDEIVRELSLSVKSCGADLSRDVLGAYASDLLSDVMAHAEKGFLWITLQIHQNIVAVAVLKELAGIVIVNNREPEAGTLSKAEQERVPIVVTELSTFEIAGRLYQLGLRGQVRC